MSSVDNINANDTIVQDTKDLVLSQFAESETIQKFAELIAERVDDYEKLAESIHTSFLLANATGQTLDFIGEFINLPRDNRTDEQYRNAIIFSAIGSSIEVNREGIESLIALVTGQLGGYFVQGKYKDIYLYLQESCLDRGTAREFLDRYMPLGTELSLLFESGLSFGFEGNDAAAGFGTVTAKAAEGQALSKFSLSDAKDSPEYTLPRASTFTHGADDKVFRSGDPVDLLSNIRAFQWDVPSAYSQGDTVTFSATGQRDSRDETTPVSFTKQITLDDASDNPYELGFEIARAFDENGIVSSDEIIFDDSGGTSMFVGYEPITDESKFSSRASEAIEVDTQGNMTLKGVDEVRYRYGIDNDTGSEVITGIVYEMPSDNEIIDSDDFSNSSWTRSTSVVSESTETFLLAIQSFYNLVFNVTSEVTKSITPQIPDRFYTFSVYINVTGDTREGFLRIDNDYLYFDCTDGSVVSSDFSRSNVEPIADVYRVQVTKQFSGTPTVTLGIGVDYSGSSEYTLKVGGAQFEPWHKATSYIPTNGSVTQRAQDFLSINDTEDDVSGFSGTYFVNIDGKDTSGAYGWGCHELIAKQAEQYAVEDGENFTPDDTNGVDIIATQAAEQFYEGFGEIVEAPEESTSEWGRLCSRESLTSRDFLDLPPVNPEDFEYSLDSRFANVQSLIRAIDAETKYYADTSEGLSETEGGDYFVVSTQNGDELYLNDNGSATLIRTITSGNPRALQRSEGDEAWAGPVWDSSLSGQSDAVGRGLALRSPDGTQQYVGIVETTKQDIAGQNIERSFGDLSVPEAPFYYEIDVELYPVDPVVTELSHSLVTRYISNVLNEDDGYSRVDVEQSLAINIAYNGTDYDSKAEFSHFQVNEDKENSQASVDSSEITATAETILDNYTAASVPSTQRIGVLVDGRQGIIRVYKDGVEYDNNTGLITLDSVNTSGNPDNAPSVGDAATLFQNFSDSFVIAAQGSTDNDQPEPSSLDDYGMLRFVYEPTQLSHTSQLPPGTTDIFGRNIETLVQ